MNTEKSLAALGRLVDIMARLRSADGCPWDAEQTPETLKPYLVEEVYEVIDAIDSGNPRLIQEELGDLLLQIVFQARIFEERNLFCLNDVAETIAAKLVRRHPHVFTPHLPQPGNSLKEQWEQIKAKEKRDHGVQPSTFGDIPAAAPALARARKVIERAERAGLCSPPLSTTLDTLQLDLNVFRQAAEPRDQTALEEQLGHLLLNLVRLSGRVQIDPEVALRKTVNTFISQCEIGETSTSDPSWPTKP